MGFGFILVFWVFTICKPKVLGNSSQIMVDLSCGSLVSNKLEQLTISRRTETDESVSLNPYFSAQQQQQHSSFPQHQNESLERSSRIPYSLLMNHLPRQRRTGHWLA
ncbi:uncharacterized protein LOC130718257 [Lotus japonicus]|uniref:uncharacterized protein LOC130718257 n=1 Tax=Lotus japonicus TaxID=34305 RepID=UPI002585F243|nr:uncharacterized protein LOC130718257 [Lotus japonicus]